MQNRILMTDEEKLIERLKRVEALHAGAATPGERGHGCRLATRVVAGVLLDDPRRDAAQARGRGAQEVQ